MAAEKAGGAAATAAAKEAGIRSIDSTLDTAKSTAVSKIEELDIPSMMDDTAGNIASQVGSQVTLSIFEQLDTPSTQLSDGAAQIRDGVLTYTSTVADGAKQLADGTNELASGMATLYEGTGTLASGTETLNANSGALKTGANKLASGAKELADGMAKIFSGSVELKDGVVKINDKGIKKIAEFYEKDGKNLDKTIKELRDAAKSYTTFTGAADGTSSSVKFIIKNEGIGE